jgi:hypothetical protein
MPTNLLTVSADGLAGHNDYVDIFREYADRLAEHGMEYEEADPRAEPVTATLFVTLTTAALAAAVSEVIKVIVKRVCDRAEKDPAPPTIQITLNANHFILPQDREVVVAQIESLTER